MRPAASGQCVRSVRYCSRCPLPAADVIVARKSAARSREGEEFQTRPGPPGPFSSSRRVLPSVGQVMEAENRFSALTGGEWKPWELPPFCGARRAGCSEQRRSFRVHLTLGGRKRTDRREGRKSNSILRPSGASLHARDVAAKSKVSTAPLLSVVTPERILSACSTLSRLVLEALKGTSRMAAS
ncbi:hypothetical protein V5799_020394 [Amblyomma americanum]|uniref:Uncharacterized protein n=1 Tax=Amblyomma americanum TaxID=6943 RepID=A0AAQ4EU21_AMBAM